MCDSNYILGERRFVRALGDEDRQGSGQAIEEENCGGEPCDDDCNGEIQGRDVDGKAGEEEKEGDSQENREEPDDRGHSPSLEAPEAILADACAIPR